MVLDHNQSLSWYFNVVFGCGTGGRGNRDEPRAAGLGYGGGGGSPQRGGLSGGGGGSGGDQDPYNSYRKQRAGAYHDLMARAAAAATAPKAAHV